MASQKPYLAAEKGRGHNTDPCPCLGEDSTLWLVPPNQGTWPHGVREAKEKEVIYRLYFKRTSCVSPGLAQVFLSIFPLLPWEAWNHASVVPTMEGVGTPGCSGGNVEW